MILMSMMLPRTRDGDPGRPGVVHQPRLHHQPHLPRTTRAWAAALHHLVARGSGKPVSQCTVVQVNSEQDTSCSGILSDRLSTSTPPAVASAWWRRRAPRPAAACWCSAPARATPATTRARRPTRRPPPSGCTSSTVCRVECRVPSGSAYWRYRLRCTTALCVFPGEHPAAMHGEAAPSASCCLLRGCLLLHLLLLVVRRRARPPHPPRPPRPLRTKWLGHQCWCSVINLAIERIKRMVSKNTDVIIIIDYSS